MKERVRILLESPSTDASGFEQMIYDAPVDAGSIAWYCRKPLKYLKVGDPVTVARSLLCWEAQGIAFYEEGKDLSPCENMDRFVNCERCLLCMAAKECHKAWFEGFRKETDRILKRVF